MKKSYSNLDDCKTLGLPLLVLMGTLAVSGIVLTVVLHHFLG